MRTKMTVAGAVLCLILIGGVSIHSIRQQRLAHDRDYPYEWEPLKVEWLGCPELTGQYFFKGDWKWTGDTHTYTGEPLSAFIGQQKLSELTRVQFKPNLGIRERDYFWTTVDKLITHVSLVGPINSELRVSLWTHEALLYETTLDSGYFDCQFGVLRLKQAGETGSISFATYDFQKASDGSLVASVSRTTFGLLVIVPYKEQSTTWLRWQPKQTSVVPPGLKIGPSKADF